jgi:hypothetical protein
MELNYLSPITNASVPSFIGWAFYETVISRSESIGSCLLKLVEGYYLISSFLLFLKDMGSVLVW